jgi:hypothetical protein
MSQNIIDILTAVTASNSLKYPKSRVYCTCSPSIFALHKQPSVHHHHHHHHHHNSEHGQGLGLKTCSFEAQGVPCPSNLLSVFPDPAIPEVGTGSPKFSQQQMITNQTSYQHLVIIQLDFQMF